MVQMLSGLTVYHDGHNRILIHLAPNHMYGTVQGLCGSDNKNQKDEFTTPQGELNILSYRILVKGRRVSKVSKYFLVVQYPKRSNG